MKRNHFEFQIPQFLSLTVNAKITKYNFQYSTVLITIITLQIELICNG